MSNNNNEKFENLSAEELELANLEETILDELDSTPTFKMSWPQNLFNIIVCNSLTEKHSLTENAEDVLLQAMQALTPREEIVMRLHYKDHKSFDEIGKELNATWEMLEDIESTAIRKLRHLKNISLLKQL
ncbi:MAG: sigma-70 family RNA polymerase sigma factor [Clostridia bacterium]|nr:sigma-70 family RNA polymerase sigma factor [Clostridia bacterium]